MNVRGRRHLVPKDISVIEALDILDKFDSDELYFQIDESAWRSVSDCELRCYAAHGGDLKLKISELPVMTRVSKTRASKKLKFCETYKLKMPVVIMAGGKGERLFPYTQTLPKPLITVNDKTISELIIDKFSSFGCSDFYMIVNYRKEQIKEFFKENVQDVNVHFIDENRFLGTGGGLKLLSGKIKETFFMTNCDILVNCDYTKILQWHRESKSIITVVCAAEEINIPYGIVKMQEDGDIGKIIEKPCLQLLVNTGLYVIEPEFIDYIDDDTFVHITDIIQNCIDAKERVGMYPVGRGAWMEMGTPQALNKMKSRLAGKSCSFVL